MIKAKTIAEIVALLEESVRDLPLATAAEDIVPGEGNEGAQVMFIGEAPGYHESVERRPFVGRSGALLRKTIEEVGLDARQYFISNIVKVRPPDNRDPTPEEIAAFKPFLDLEISVIDPELVVTLGRFSMSKFLPDVKISQVHGRLHKIQWQAKKLFILPMYHPAAGLRSTKVKQSFQADIAKIPAVLEYLAEKKQQEVDAEELLSALL